MIDVMATASKRICKHGNAFTPGVLRRFVNFIPIPSQYWDCEGAADANLETTRHMERLCGRPGTGCLERLVRWLPISARHAYAAAMQHVDCSQCSRCTARSPR